MRLTKEQSLLITNALRMVSDTFEKNAKLLERDTSVQAIDSADNFRNVSERARQLAYDLESLMYEKGAVIEVIAQ